jgi:hypothetical protein
MTGQSGALVRVRQVGVALFQPETQACPAYLLECSTVAIVAEDRRPVGGRDYPRTYQEF